MIESPTTYLLIHERRYTAFHEVMSNKGEKYTLLTTCDVCVCVCALAFQIKKHYDAKIKQDRPH